MFELNGKQYSVDDLQNAAVKYGMDYNTYLSKMMEKGLKEIKPAKTEAVTTETAPVTAENQAVSTDLVSENGSSDSQKPKPDYASQIKSSEFFKENVPYKGSEQEEIDKKEDKKDSSVTINDLLKTLDGVNYKKESGKFETDDSVGVDVFQKEEEQAVPIFSEMFKGSGINFKETSTVGLDPFTGMPNVNLDAMTVSIGEKGSSSYKAIDIPLEVEGGVARENLTKLKNFIKENKDKVNTYDWSRNNRQAEKAYDTWKDSNVSIEQGEQVIKQETLKNPNYFDIIDKANEPKTSAEKYASARTMYAQGVGVTYSKLQAIDALQQKLNEAKAIISKKSPKISSAELDEAARNVVRQQDYQQRLAELEEKEIQAAIKRGEISASVMYVGGVASKSKKTEKFNKDLDVTNIIINQTRVTNNDTEFLFENIKKAYREDGDGLVISPANQGRVLSIAKKLGVDLDMSDKSQVQLKNGNIISSNYYKIMQASRDASTAGSLLINNRLKEQSDLASAIGDDDLALIAAGKNYNMWDQAANSVLLGAGDLLVGAGRLTAEINPFTLVERIEDAVSGNFESAFSPKFAKLGADWVEFSNKDRETYARSVSFDDAFKSGGAFMQFALQETATQIPIIAAIVASGGTAAPWVIGASTMGSKMNELGYENINLADGEKYSNSDIWLKSLGYGALEGSLSAVSGTRVLRNAKTRFISGGKQAAETLLENSAKTWAIEQGKGLGADVIVEAGAEALTTGGQNLIDGKPFTENMAHAAFSGFGMSTLMGGVPYFRGLYYSSMSNYAALSDIRGIQSDIDALSKRWATAQTESGAKIYAEAIADKYTKLNDAVIKQESLINNNLTSGGANKIVEITSKLAALQNKAKAISESKDLSTEEKNAQIKPLLADFNSLKSLKDKALGHSSLLKNETEFKAFQALQPLKYDQYVDQATQELIGERNGKEPNNIDVDNRAYDLYFGDIVRAENAKLGRKNSSVFKSFKSFETVDEAIADLDNVKDLSPEDKAEIILGLKNGNDGYANKSTGTQVAVVENQVANQRKYTKVHEVGHKAFWNLLGNNENNAAFKQVSEQILSTLNKTDKKVHDSLLKDGVDDDSGNIIPAEVISRFLEYVSEGKVTNVQKAKGISGLFGVMIQKQFSKDYNFDFRGEQDIYNFVVGVGKKIKDGTLTTVDIKKAKSGDLIKSVTKDSDKTVSKESSVSFSKANKELGDEIKALVPEGTSKSRYDNQVIGNVYEKLVFGKTLDGLINGQLNKYGVVGDNVYGKPKDLFLEDVKAQLYEKSLMRFNPETNNDLGGFVVNELIKYRIGDVVNRYKKEAGVEGKSLDVAAGEVGSVQEVADESISIEDQIDLDATQARSDTRLTKATKIMSKEQYDRAAKMVEEKLKDIDPKKLSYKKIGGLATDILSEITDVPAGKILDATKNLSKEETSRGAMFIEKNIDYIRKTLPKGAVQEAATEKLMGTATGVANSILKRLYDKNPRIKKGAGLSPWSIKPDITNQDILDAIGRPKREGDRKIQINPRSPEGQVIKGILNLVDRNIANELARTVESDLTLEQKQDIAAGKSDVMFSKALAKVLVESAVNHLGIKTRVGKGKLVGTVNDLLTTESYGGEEDFNKSLDNLTKEQRQVVDLVFGGRDWLFGMFSDTEAVKNNGVRYEKIIKEAIKNVGIKGVSVDLSEGGFGSGVDLVLTVNGKNINIELKLNRKAQMGSFSINIDGDSFSYTKSVDGLIEKLPDLHEAIQNSLKSEKYLKAVDDYNKRGVELGGYYDEATGVLSGSESMFLQLVKEGKLKATNLNIKEDSKGKKLDIGIINLIYNNKGVFNMDIGGKGLYYLGTNKDNLPTSKLEGNSSLMIRRTYNQIGKTGIYKSIVRAFAKLDSNITESNINFSILSNTEQDIKTIATNFSKSVNLDKEFNDIIENKTGIESYKNYKRVKAQVTGASKGKFNFFIAPSAEDFVGLLYKTLGKGKIGDAQMAWYKENLLDPYARAMQKVSRDRNFMARNFLAIKKELKIVPKNLKKKIPGEPFTQEQAIRVYIWNKKGSTIPEISENDSIYLTNFVENNEKLKTFADQVIALSGLEDYAKPGDSWVTGTITTDMLEALNTTKRAKYLELWQQNANEIFSEKNLNKLEAAFGADYRKAMENILKRMKTGRNRAFGGDSLTGRFVDWMTGATGAIMFFNTRSAVLQTLSAVNFINFGDNNIFAASKAFANQKQYWSDFKKLFNSDFLVERRDGLKINVNEADIADIAKEKGVRGLINKLLKLGFTPTQLADSFAIATGGATFYRNRLKSLIKDGMDPVAAEKQAMRDFRETAEESQQSSRPDKISAQQAGPLGRTILAFANTPAQYARIIKKAASDIKNGRGDLKTNVSKIMYYGVVQNLIFNALQQALFAALFDEDEEEIDDKTISIANGMADSILRGIGISGAIISVVKNAALRWVKEEEKANPKYENAILELTKISPPVSSKINKLRAASRSYSWDKKEMKEGGLSIDNPANLAIGNIVSAVTNIPLDRVVKKVQHIKAASDSEIDTYKRIFLLAGWSKWELGIKDAKKSKTKTVRSKKTYSKKKYYK